VSTVTIGIVSMINLNRSAVFLLSCQVLVRDWCGRHLVCAFQSEICWFSGLAVSSRNHDVDITGVHLIPRNMITTDLEYPFLPFMCVLARIDGAAEFVSEMLLETCSARKLAFSIDYPAQHSITLEDWLCRTGPFNSTEQQVHSGLLSSYMQTLNQFCGSPVSSSWKYTISKLHAGAQFCFCFCVTWLLILMLT
jgi:hypothetical protein